MASPHQSQSNKVCRFSIDLAVDYDQWKVQGSVQAPRVGRTQERATDSEYRRGEQALHRYADLIHFSSDNDGGGQAVAHLAHSRQNHMA